MERRPECEVCTVVWPVPGRWVRRRGSRKWHAAPGYRRFGGGWLDSVVDPPDDIGIAAVGQQEREYVDLEDPGSPQRLAWETVPEDVATFLRDWHMPNCAWPTLLLLGRIPAARELAAEVPLLAAMLGNALRRGAVGSTLRQLAHLLGTPPGMRRWRAVAAWLELDSSRGFIDVLRRLPRDHWSPSDVRALKAAWADPAGNKLLRHATVLHRNAFRLVATAVEARGTAMLHVDIFRDSSLANGESMAPTHVQQIAESWHELWPRSPLPKVRTVDEIYAQLERTRAEIRRVIGVLPPEPLVPGPPMPPPPLPAAPGIRPLDSTEALETEGQVMRHCVGNGSWEFSARNRRGYAYAIEGRGQRATLWLVRSDRGLLPFEIGEFKAEGNRPPSVQARHVVVSWMTTCQRALAEGTLTLDEAWRTPFAERNRHGIPAALLWALPEYEEIPF